MPAVSKAQREVMAIAEHHPEKLHKENKGLLSMSKGQLHDFASTKEKHLPEHARHEPPYIKPGVHPPEHKKEGRGMHKDEKHHGGRMKHPRGGGSY